MTHPDPECRKYQEEFLSSCPAAQRSMHELIFKIGNATFRYHQLAKDFKPTENDWQEWIDGLEDPMKSAMNEKGYEWCKNVLSFTRYVMEKNDQGLDEYLKANLSAYDLAEYYKILNDGK